MASIRQRRINERLMEELAMLVPGRMDDPQLAPVVVTRVQATQDLGTAKVFVTTSHPVDDEQLAEIMDALSNARRFLRSELADVGLRRVPQLVFAHDTDYEDGKRVLETLDRLGREAPDDSDGDDDESAAGDQAPSPRAEDVGGATDVDTEPN